MCVGLDSAGTDESGSRPGWSMVRFRSFIADAARRYWLSSLRKIPQVGGGSQGRLRSQLVADLPQEVFPPLDLALILDALGAEPVHHAQDGPPLLCLGQDD